MERWAFATSAAPFGLGLSSAEFWYLSHEEYDAKVTMWERHQQAQVSIVAHLRADLHNGLMPRENKQPYTPQDFGAPGKPQRDPRRKRNNQEVRTKLRMAFAGKMKDAEGKKVSALESLPPGQPLPAGVKLPPRKRG